MYSISMLCLCDGDVEHKQSKLLLFHPRFIYSYYASAHYYISKCMIHCTWACFYEEEQIANKYFSAQSYDW